MQGAISLTTRGKEKGIHKLISLLGGNSVAVGAAETLVCPPREGERVQLTHQHS